MYPYLRTALEIWLHRNKPLGLFETHETHHRIRLSDIDIFGELNNGRTLTVYDFSRIGLALRVGLNDMLKREKWGMTVAGSTVRYRRRVRAFQKVTVRARLLGWDRRFFYIEHGMFHKGVCTSHLVVRTAFTDKNGLVESERVRQAAGHEGASPVLPDWIQAWVAAEDLRPWPPMQDVLPTAERDAA